MEPDQQVEIQLGHMCNNRCVFCVSGQRTAMGEAGPMPAPPLVARIREAHARGHRKITLLGGEPTLQPGFMEIVRECVALGFDDIVVFTNGVKTARAEVIDEVRATGGQFTWRISIQGATEEHHDRTTRKPGSFARIVRTLEHLAARRERITINMCVVGSNYESVDRFPELLAAYGVSQLHLDLMRPMDAGVRTEDELRELMPRLSDLAGPLERMIAGFPPGFDVNVGNVPYCAAPSIAAFIHHDGQRTETIAIDNDDQPSRPWDKYFVKRKDKIKPPSCAECVFDRQCSGVFETYAKFHGTSELVPITPKQLAAIDLSRRFLALHLRETVAALAGEWTAEERGVEETHLSWRGEGVLRVALRGARAPGAAYRYEGLSAHVLAAEGDLAELRAAVRALSSRLIAAGHAPGAPLGDDALGLLAPSVAVRLGRLRGAAPFPGLSWRDVRVSEGGARAELDFVGVLGQRVTVWLDERDRRARGGYRLADRTRVTDALVDGIGAVIRALAAPADGAALGA